MRLHGIRVLDLSRLLPGPYGTQLLRDMGAEVIKIEDPSIGDYARIPGGLATPDGKSPTFDAVNRGKKSVTLDLKTQAGNDAFCRLVETADVVFEQFRPGVVDRLGIGYDAVREHNPEIVYCSLSGYGQTGPYRDRVGHDLNYIGYAGLLDMTRSSRDEPPVIPGYPIADMAGGMFAAFSIVSAVLSRELGNTGGEYIDVSMTDAVLSLSHVVSSRVFLGASAAPGETRLTGKYPCYNVYETKDDRYVTLAALEPKFWDAFCEAIDRPALKDRQFADDPETRRAVSEEIAAVFREKSCEEWETELADKDVMVGTVQSLDELRNNPQITARNLINTSPDLPDRFGLPAESTEASEPVTEPSPDHGEHTVTILEEIGYSSQTIESFRTNNIIS